MPSTTSQPAPIPWTAARPAVWPDAPAELTFSTLKEIEACPHRWAISNARYPALWDGRGYPQRLQLGGLAGTVVHAALETITRELVSAGCPSVEDAAAVAVLQRLGGLTQVIRHAMDKLLTQVKANPRAAGLIDHFARSLHAQAPELRGRVQTMLSRRTLPARTKDVTSGAVRRGRGPLAAGVYCEVDIRVPRLGWKGRADLLALTSAGCEITDFKTGEPADDHSLQLRIYALLWSRDDVLNPAGLLATRLVLAHPYADLAVPTPDSDELSHLETQIVARGTAARAAVAVHPPEARPSVDNCGRCGVRQMCETYWNSAAEIRLGPDSHPGTKDRAFVDVELTIERRHGPKSWDAVVHTTLHPDRGLLRTNGNIEFTPGQRLRVLDACEAIDDAKSEGVRSFTLGLFSEVFTVSPST